jgi:hypothetical protein
MERDKIIVPCDRFGNELSPRNNFDTYPPPQDILYFERVAIRCENLDCHYHSCQFVYGCKIKPKGHPGGNCPYEKVDEEDLEIGFYKAECEGYKEHNNYYDEINGNDDPSIWGYEGDG